MCLYVGLGIAMCVCLCMRMYEVCKVNDNALVVRIVYKQGGWPCRQSPQVENWPWKCGDTANTFAIFQTKELSNFALNFQFFSVEPICFIICV
jgi:hypothetical protein